VALVWDSTFFQSLGEFRAQGISIRTATQSRMTSTPRLSTALAPGRAGSFPCDSPCVGQPPPVGIRNTSRLFSTSEYAHLALDRFRGLIPLAMDWCFPKKINFLALRPQSASPRGEYVCAKPELTLSASPLRLRNVKSNACPGSKTAARRPRAMVRQSRRGP